MSVNWLPADEVGPTQARRRLCRVYMEIAILPESRSDSFALSPNRRSLLRALRHSGQFSYRHYVAYRGEDWLVKGCGCGPKGLEGLS